MLTEYIAHLTARPLIVVALTPRPSVVAERESNRQKVAYRDSFDGIEALDRALREDTPRVGLWLDNSDLGAAETVDVILRDGLDLGAIS